jgi:c-di-GMP-binding flagellar brake protein YcgR
MEKRRYHRVKFAAKGSIRYQGLTYRVRLENISLKGALVSSEECIMIPPGERCTLSVLLDAEDLPLVFTVEIVHSFFSMVGVHFVAYEKDAEQHLIELLKSITSEPERLAFEMLELSAISRAPVSPRDESGAVLPE